MSQRPVLRQSLNTRRALRLPRPRLRGRAHLVAAVLAVPSLPAWIALTPPGRPRLGVAAFGCGIGVMLVCSALLHLRVWPAVTHERLLRLDHSGIYLAIGGTGIPLALLGLQGLPSRILLAVSVTGTITGIVVEWLPFAPPRGFSNSVYLTLGWIPLALLPWLWDDAGALTVALLVLGGLLYTIGAVIVGLRRPNPAPAWFGYHELFHLLVIAAVVVHGVMIARLASPDG